MANSVIYQGTCQNQSSWRFPINNTCSFLYLGEPCYQDTFSAP